jgi:hypothetical protein
VFLAGTRSPRVFVGAIWEGKMAVIFVRKAQALPGKEVEAIKFGTEIAKMVADIVGVEVIVGQQIGGPIGQIGWRATYADMAVFEKAMSKINANEPYRQHIAKHLPSIFMPGSGRDELWRTL